MTSRVYINIEADDAGEARDQMKRLLGSGYALTRVLTGDAQTDHETMTAYEPEPVDPVALTKVGERIAETQASDPAPTRERGKPSPGHKRRTNAEIAEDDAAAHASVMNETAAEADAANAVAAISTGEERVGPEDTVEDQEADAADEAAETAAATKERAAEGKPALTLDDIRTVLGNYQKVYGLPAAMEDGPKVLSEIVSGAAKVSDIPEDKIADAIAALKAAGKTNRFKRAAVAA
jgi:hypothetical protein